MTDRTRLAACIFVVGCSICFGKSFGTAGDARQQLLSDSPTAAVHVMIQAAGRGKPYINFEDGIALPVNYEAPPKLQALLNANAAEPRVLASGDFDEDGVPDLVCGYALQGAGVVTLYRGNIDSIFQNSFEAQRVAEGKLTPSAFLSPARVFEAPIAADFIGAGDFDGDGHCDVVVASRGGDELYLLPGDGKGNLISSRKIQVPGAVTSLAVGEINRADGLTDVVVGAVSHEGPKALVFEGPEGALKARPEIFSLPGEPQAMVMGQFDNEYTMDLAVGAGSELVIIHGRDRKLSIDEIRKAEVPPAKIDRRSFKFEVRSIATGDFAASNEPSIAVLTADGTVFLMSPVLPSLIKKVAKKRGIQTDEALGQWPGAAQLLCARVSTGPADDLIILNRDRRSLQILKTGGSSAAISSPSSSVRVNTSLDLDREPVAVLSMRLNGDALDDLVVLQDGDNAPAILKTAAPQTFSVNTTDDHDDGNCDADCTLREAMNAANANAGADTIGFNIPGAGAHTISPTSPLPLITDPVTIDGYTQSGASPNTLANGNNAVLRIELNGSNAGFSGNGLTLVGGSSVVRGLVINRFRRAAPGVGNGILVIANGGNLIEGNFIGTDITGSTDQGNAESGIAVENTSSNRIGWTAPASRNVISGNDLYGVLLFGILTPYNLVQGNFIGTDLTGTLPIGNGVGIGIRHSPAANIIGGSVAGARNIISGNQSGAHMSSAIGTLLQGNLIGTDVNGSTPLANLSGVFLDTESSSNTIGGTTAGARNVVSGNVSGIISFVLTGTLGNVFQGNFVGVNSAGTAPLGNSVQGILSNGGRGTVFGGTSPGAGNVISFNGTSGIISQFGPTCLILNNTISFNGDYGVWVPDGVQCSILGNSIFGNANIGINLGLDLITANDPCDSDSGGGNDRQNYPVLTAAVTNGSNVTIQGMLNSTPGTSFTIEFFANNTCDPLGFGEGQTFIGSTIVTTATNCGTTFDVTLAASVQAGRLITATATDPAGNTSEFSQCLQAQPPPFDLCIQDESNGNILLVNSTTGEYQFTNCAGTTLTGTGTLSTKGCGITLQVDGPDRRILARIDTCSKFGNASIQLFTPPRSFSVLDRNTSNNICSCSGTG
jgi:CSLREA domain-containing protein